MLSYFQFISGTRLGLLLTMSNFFMRLWRGKIVAKYHSIRGTDEEISKEISFTHMQFIYVTVIKSFNKFRL